MECLMCNNVMVGQKNFIQNITKETELSDINLICRPFCLCEECAGLVDSLDVAQTTARRLQNSLLKYLTNSKLLGSNVNVSVFQPKTDVEVEFHENVNKVEIAKNRTEDSSSLLRPYSCSVCSKTWRTASELKNHIKTHSNMRYICEVCGQKYKQKCHFDIHMGMHGGINPFTCEWCNKSFTQKVALQRHRLLHTGEAPHQCEACGKRFVHTSSFRIHRLSHGGQKNHKCDRCGLALVCGSHLKRHMRVHSGEKPYPCATCGRRFAERYNLAAHTKTHTNDSTYL